MQQKSTRIHMFHCIMDEMMISDLMGLSVSGEKMSFSGLIVGILSDLTELLDKKHFENVQRGSCYKTVTDDPEAVRKDVFVYMPEQLYKRLKIMHQDLNVYSIAQLVREFLRFYLNIVKKYKKNAGKILKRLIEKWRLENVKYQFNCSIHQLREFIDKNMNRLKLFNLYDDNFCPARIIKL